MNASNKTEKSSSIGLDWTEIEGRMGWQYKEKGNNGKDDLKYQRNILKKAGSRAENSLNDKHDDPNYIEKLIDREAKYHGLWIPHQFMKEIETVPPLEEVTYSLIFEDKSLPEAYQTETGQFWNTYNTFKEELADFVAFGVHRENELVSSLEEAGLEEYESEDILRLVEKYAMGKSWDLDRYIDRAMQQEGLDIELDQSPELKSGLYDTAQVLSQDFSTDKIGELLSKSKEYMVENDKDLEKEIKHILIRESELEKEEIEDLVTSIPYTGNLIRKMVPDISEDRLIDVTHKILNKERDFWKRARGKKAKAVKHPNQIDREILTSNYSKKWSYALAESWLNGNCDCNYFNSSERDNNYLHMRLARLASGINTNYYNGKNLIPTGLLRHIKQDLGLRLEKPVYWNTSRGSGNIIVNAQFPITEEDQGKLLGSVLDGNTLYQSSANQLVHKYGEKNSEIRKKALKRLTNSFGSFSMDEIARESDITDLNPERAKKNYSSSVVTLPAQLIDLLPEKLPERFWIKQEGPDEEIADQLSAETSQEFAFGYVNQALWENGRAYGEGLEASSYKPNLFKTMLEKIDLKQGEDFKTKKRDKHKTFFRFNHNTVEETDWIKEITDFYDKIKG